MNKTVLGVVVAVVVIGLGVFVFANKGSAPAPSDTQAAQSDATLRELAQSGSPQKCTFTSAQNSSGTVFVAGGKVRGDFSAQVNGQAMMGHMIVMDNTSYVWMDGMAQGFKNSFDATHSTSSGQAAPSQGVDPDERVSYSCEPWPADQGLFVLPQNITFMAIGAAQVQSGAGAVGASCGQCDLIPDAGAKAQCKAALQC